MHIRCPDDIIRKMETENMELKCAGDCSVGISGCNPLGPVFYSSLMDIMLKKEEEENKRERERERQREREIDVM